MKPGFSGCMVYRHIFDLKWLKSSRRLKKHILNEEKVGAF
jgi:hypothetical protein